MRTNDVIFIFFFIIIYLIVMGLDMSNTIRFNNIQETQAYIIDNQSKIIQKLERRGLSIPDKQTRWAL